MEFMIFVEPQFGASCDDLLRVEVETELLGFDGFFRSDHYMPPDAEPVFTGTTDAWISLAGIARETSRLRIGSLVSPVTFRPPGPFALAASQVNQMSSGRVEMGLGAGWSANEHEAYGLISVTS